MTAAAITVIERAKVELINDLHLRCERAYGQALVFAVECGQHLAAVKAQLRHGEFGAWVDDHFNGSQRTAQTYMQLAAAPADDAQRVAGFSIRQARDAIAKPKRATASDAGALLQGLAGAGTQLEPARIDHARDRLRAEQPEDAWTDPERRKASRATGILADTQATLDEAQTAGLSRYSISETLKAAANETRKAAVLLEELAFSFER